MTAASQFLLQFIRTVDSQRRRIHIKAVFFTSRPKQASVVQRSMTIREIKTAGLIVIGDEILKGQVHDTNSHFISKVLYDLGVKVKRISVVGDCEDDIVKEVKDLSPQFTFVITSGGIGPTHDDITFMAIAKAFDEPLMPHPKLVKICTDFYKTSDLSAPAMKLAHIPKSARLTFGYDRVTGKQTFYPNVSVRNVYIFPGVPQLLQRSFIAVCDELFGGGYTKFHLKKIYLTADETTIASTLNAVVTEFPHVTFGSYPKFYDSYYKVRLTIESQSEDEVILAHNKLMSSLPKEFIIDYDNAPLDNAHDKLMKLAARKGKYMQEAVRIMETCCQSYKPEEMCVYFDGEKESTAILHLFYACLKNSNVTNLHIVAIHVVQKKPSQEMDNYVKETSDRYNLKIEKLPETSESSLRSYLSLHSEIKVMVAGTTKDVNSLEKFPFLLDSSIVKLSKPFETWTDSILWDFVHSLYLPYCK